ncbi:tyrosine-type recombinase/integrase [Pseudoalteromonas xiamenensis]|uniref:tyrosine-type recombinase/integrase n=1 Tax=Pseudoalteromonas xiamenensis TaxID=882626 RepID=UPI0035E922F1
MPNLTKICYEYLSICKHAKGLSNLTLKAYEIDLKQFSQQFPKKTRIADINKDQIMAFQKDLFDKGLSATSIKRKMACLKSLFKWLEQEERMPLNPFHKINTQIKLPKRLPKNVSSQELYRIINCLRSKLNLTDDMVYCANELSSTVKSRSEMNILTTLVAIEIMLVTGIRVSELTNIKISDIDIYNKKIKIFGKGSRERFVFIPDDTLVTLILAYIKSRAITLSTHCQLLTNSKGKPASTQFIRKQLKTVSIEANITPHMLRHTAASELLDTGLDIRFVQRLLGHANISTTEIYTHVSNSALQSKIEQASVRKKLLTKHG